ncbi:MAG: muconolactone Delta-isomerase family protein [Bacteroidota bacterium]
MQYRFMADCTLSAGFQDQEERLLTNQQDLLQRFLEEGILVNYALSLEHSKLWAVFNATSEMEVLEIMIAMPLSHAMQIEVSLLSAFDSNQAPPSFSMN